MEKLVHTVVIITGKIIHTNLYNYWCVLGRAGQFMEISALVLNLQLRNLNPRLQNRECLFGQAELIHSLSLHVS